MLSSTTFVFIVSRFSAFFGCLTDFEKKSFASMGVKKFLEPNFEEMVNPTKMVHTSKFFS